MAVRRILAVATNQATYGTNPHRTGLWIGELVHFHARVRQAGFEVDLVSPAGARGREAPTAASAATTSSSLTSVRVTARRRRHVLDRQRQQLLARCVPPERAGHLRQEPKR